MVTRLPTSPDVISCAQAGGQAGGKTPATEPAAADTDPKTNGLMCDCSEEEVQHEVELTSGFKKIN